MSQTTLTLDLQFKTAQGKSRTMGIRDPKAELDREIVEGAMQTIAQQAMFENEGDQLYAKVKGARYVTRTVDEIFTVEESGENL